jgi:hypothetical protein
MERKQERDRNYNENDIRLIKKIKEEKTFKNNTKSRGIRS